MARLPSRWERLDGGYLDRHEEVWFLQRLGRMATGGTNGWAILLAVPEHRVGRDDRMAYHREDGTTCLRVVDGHPEPAPANCDPRGTLYAHWGDAGSLAEAKAVVEAAEARAGVS